MTKTEILYDLAKILRSKNSGPFELTIDVIFDDEEKYRMVKESKIITKELISRLYKIDKKDISALVFFDPALAFKITMKRFIDSGSIGETDVYGAQQHAPLMDLKIPVE